MAFRMYAARLSSIRCSYMCSRSSSAAPKVSLELGVHLYGFSLIFEPQESFLETGGIPVLAGIVIRAAFKGLLSAPNQPLDGQMNF